MLSLPIAILAASDTVPGQDRRRGTPPPGRRLLAALLATGLGVALAGCTSSVSGIDALDISAASPVDLATTASVRPLAPVASVPVDGESATATPTARAVEGESELGFAAPEPEKPVQVAVMRGEDPAPAGKRAGRIDRPRIYKARFSDADPVNFGKLSPKPFAVHGVDVSRWQGEIDWHDLRRHGANFAFIKATDGGDHLDPMFAKNWRGAAEAGVARGAYHFFYWCRSASSQADWFIRNVPKTKGALPPVVDVEWNHTSKTCRKRPSRAVVLEKMKVFMDRLEAHYGQRPIIYTAPDFYEDNLKGAFPNHPFWLRSVAAHPRKVYPGRDFVFWQYSGTGLANSHDTQIDLNVFNGSADGWHRWLSANLH